MHIKSSGNYLKYFPILKMEAKKRANGFSEYEKKPKNKKNEISEEDPNIWISQGCDVISIRQIQKIEDLKNDNANLFHPTFVFQVFFVGIILMKSYWIKKKQFMDIRI